MAKIIIKLNGEKKEIQQGTILDLINSYKLLPSEIIIELNEKIIHQTMYEKQTISPNDSIEIIRYIGGGKD